MPERTEQQFPNHELLTGPKGEVLPDDTVPVSSSLLLRIAAEIEDRIIAGDEPSPHWIHDLRMAAYAGSLTIGRFEQSLQFSPLDASINGGPTDA